LKKRQRFEEYWIVQQAASPLEHAYGYFIASLLNLSLTTTGPELKPMTLTSPSATYSIVTLNYDCVVENFETFIGRCHGEETLRGIPKAKLHGSVESKRIIPPTWNKVLHPESVSTWKRAFDLLRKANHIRIMGYSLPTADSYVKYLLKSAAMAAPHLKGIDVLCMDPTGAVKVRYDEFISFYRYRFTRASVVDYLNGHFEALVKPFEHNLEQPMICDKLEAFH